MAGDWLKVEVSTLDKPEVIRIARILKIDRDAAFGKLVRLWVWFDSNSVDGVVDGVVSTDVDDLCRQPGFARACMEVGWLAFDDDLERIELPHFDRHNGKTAKTRALKNRRQESWRKSVDASVDSDVDARLSTTASTREEKRRDIPVGASTPPARPDPKKAAFDAGVAILGESKATRSLLAKLIKDHGVDTVRWAIGETVTQGPVEPKSYLLGLLKKGEKGRVDGAGYVLDEYGRRTEERGFVC